MTGCLAKRLVRAVPHRSLRLAIIATCALGCTGCVGRRDRAGDAATLTILYAGSDERVLGPAWDDTPKFLVFLPLVEIDERGEPRGRLAERWSHSRDLREWTFHLRQGVRWHDGVPVTAQDIAFTLGLVQGALQWALPTASRVHVLDDSTLTISYPAPPRDPFHEWTVFWPKHLLETLDSDDIMSWDFWVRPVGNGPYRYARHVPQTMLELEASPDFYGGAPKIGHVVLRFGGSSKLAELLSGNVDVVMGFNPTDLPRVVGDPRFRAYYYIDTGLKAVFWNHRSPLFESAAVRRALTMGINRRELGRALNLPAEVPLTDALFTVRQLRRGVLPAALPFDPDSAARLLDAAGWSDTDGDGVREWDGRVFEFTALTRSEPTERQAAVYVQDQLRRIGVRMDVQVLDGSVIWPRLTEGEFAAAVFPFVNSIESQLRWLGEASPLGYDNAVVSALLHEAERTGDPDARDRIYRDLAPLLSADMPVTFLFPVVQNVVAHRRVRGLDSPFKANILLRLEQLWLEDEEQLERDRG